VDALDYRGQRPTRPQRDKLINRASRALDRGWTEPALAEQLDLGTGEVKSAVAVYLHRLSENNLPDPPAAASSQPSPARCPDCDENGFHYSDPVLMTGPYRCRGQQAACSHGTP
jgi:hypothetical protein